MLHKSTVNHVLLKFFLINEIDIHDTIIWGMLAPQQYQQGLWVEEKNQD